MDTPRRLSAADIQRALPRLSEVCSPVDAERLERLLPLCGPTGTGPVTLAACLEALHLEGSQQTQQAAFRAFRQRLHHAAQRAGLGWELAVDTKKRTPPAQRHCWFALLTPDRSTQQAEAFAEGVVATLPPPQTLVHSRAVVALESQQPVALLVAAAPDVRDQALAEQLVQRVQLELQATQRYHWRILQTTVLPVGAEREATLADYLQRADVLVELLSVTWLAHFDRTSLVGAGLRAGSKPHVPVVLREVDVARHQLHGLDPQTLFRLGTRSFEACTPLDKDRFAHHLAQQLEACLDPSLVVATPSPRRRSRRRTLDLDAYATRLADLDAAALEQFIPSHADVASLDDRLEAATPDSPSERSVVALDALLAWATNPTDTPYCALLGEYGMGKTTTLKQLTATLLQRRQAGAAVPLPIFLDLCHYSQSVHEGKVPDLPTLLQEMLSRVWESPLPTGFRADDILRLVRQEGAILICDGLDEKLVHLDEQQGRAFLRTLFQALPPGRERAASGQPGRLILSCRSHYFPTLRAQQAMLTTEGRDSVRPATYRAWVLLPFREEQIQQYLSGVLGAEQAEAALELFAAVHNLSELAQRPYLLALMAGHISALEQRRARGEVVLGVTLYDLLVEAWLARDGGKHHFDPEDKQRLMEDIAADMWRAGAREWEWRQVRHWLGARLAQDTVFQARYAGELPAVLETDLRTATFVLRPDRSQEHFRFAHTSLQEYFLARALLRALVERTPSGWDLPLPSPETLDFLGQLLQLAPTPRRDTALQTLSQMLEHYQPPATDLALRYWLRAVPQGLPTPTPRQVDLHGADLAGLVFQGAAPEQPLSLRQANLAHTHLRGTRFTHVDLSGADLSQAQATDVEFHQVQADDLDVSGADLTAAIWRYSTARGLRGTATAQWYDCRWIACTVPPDTLPADFAQHGSLRHANPTLPPLPDLQPAQLTLGFGHRGRVRGCAWSPDGTRVLSASGDHSLKVWDAASGQCLRTLSGHTNAVWGCAWSPDGTRLLSASEDESLKVWDAATGQCLRTLSGHTKGVVGCAWSPDGRRLLSASGDRSLKVWDAASGQCLATLYHAPEGESLALDEAHNRVLAASPGAWRYLGWRVFDPQAQRLRILPAEHFGPLPVG